MSIRIAEPRPQLWIARWEHPVLGPRWTLSLGDRSVITRGSEIEVRRYAREMGWIVTTESEAP